MKKLLLPISIVAAIGITTAAHAQSRPISGTAVDNKGEGIPSAFIKVPGSDSVKAITDEQGHFMIDLDDTDTKITIDAPGYEPQTLDAGDGDKELSITLKSLEVEQSEVVVTALNIARDPRTLGYSITKVNMDEVEKSGERNAVEALAAKSPGIQVTSSAGTPGASAKISIRGNSTFTEDNAPLYVVDGMPIDNSTSQPIAGDYPYNMNLTGVNESNRGIDLNPDDIADISILRGPAAAALYGQRGANGAIMITTKKGKYNKGLGITTNSSLELNLVSRLPKYQKLYSQGVGGVYSVGSTPNSWGAKMSDLGLPVYDNYSNFFQTGVGYNNTVAISNGNDKTTFRASIGNYNASGIIPNSKINRTTTNISGEAKLSPWLKVGATGNYTYNEGRMIQNGSNTAGSMLSLMRMPVSYDVRQNWFDAATNTTENYFPLYDNPLFSAYKNPYTTTTNRFFGNTYANAKLLPGLSFNGRLGVDAVSNQTKQVYALGSNGNDASDGTGQLNLSTTHSLQVYSDLLLNYDKQFGDIHLNAMGGYNYWYNGSNYIFSRGTNQAVPNVYNLGNYANLYSSNADGYQHTQAALASIGLAYKDEIYLNASGRNEWNTSLNNKSFFYGSVDASWVFTERIKSNNILTYGKLRVAYSDAGNAPSSYSNKNYFTVPNFTDGFANGNSFPYNGVPGYMYSNINYPGSLTPAHVRGKEIGLETRFWEDKITFEATYYSQKSLNNILDRPVGPSSGFQYEYTNTGEMTNKGVELALNWKAFENKDWTVSLGGNFTKNVSKVTKLAEGVSEISIESGFSSIYSYAIVGQPYGVFYGSAWEKDASGKMIVDADGLPIVTSQNQKLGNPNPDWLMGLNGSVSFKGITFSMLWDIRHGGQIWNGTWARLERIGRSNESADRERTYVLDAVTESGEKNTTAISATNYFQYVKGDLGATENAIQNGGWVRLRSVDLSYRFKFPQKYHIKYVEVGMTGRNLLLFTKYKGVDPETSLTGAGSNLGGWDYFNNPGSKSWIFNLRFGF